MAPGVQRVPVLRPVGGERAAAVGRLALCGGRHGQLVRQDGVRDTSSSASRWTRHGFTLAVLFSRRGFIFGLWSACASVGNILGAFLASSVLKYGYEVQHTRLRAEEFVPRCSQRTGANEPVHLCSTPSW